jgi:hypothetical protein
MGWVPVGSPSPIHRTSKCVNGLVVGGLYVIVQAYADIRVIIPYVSLVDVKLVV